MRWRSAEDKGKESACVLRRKSMDRDSALIADQCAAQKRGRTENNFTIKLFCCELSKTLRRYIDSTVTPVTC